MKTLGLRDVIGPIMVGPSSSHTAGALAIARMARQLCGTRPVRATFTLYGSFAHTGNGHGTEYALVAGLLGLAADDLAIRRSFELARAGGLAFEFVRKVDDSAGGTLGETAGRTEAAGGSPGGSAGGSPSSSAGVAHPNTVDILIEEEGGAALSVRGVSVGGGAAVITRIDGIDVDITGEHTSVVVRQHDELGVLAHIATCLAECGVNIATTRMYRTRKGQTAYTVMETDDAVPTAVRAAIEAHPAVQDVRVIPAMRAGDDTGGSTSGELASDVADSGTESAPANGDAKSVPTSSTHRPAGHNATPQVSRSVLAEPEQDADEWFARRDFASGAELLARCAENECSIAEAFRAREKALCAANGTAANIDGYLTRVLEVMRTSATEPLAHPAPSMGGLIGGEARRLAESLEGASTPLLDPLSAAASTYALAVLETNASMGRIVAAPTAGSAGVVPGVLLALGEQRGFPDEELKEGLLTAAAVGYLIARNASVSGAEGGCQAEIGSATAMAAAAATELVGGSPAAALAAASNALTCLMGLVCDPVGGLVEVPCQKRNATAAATALVCAQIALAGMENLVDFDETVAAMDKVGRALPFELRESALGGLAATPSACAFCAQRG